MNHNEPLSHAITTQIREVSSVGDDARLICVDIHEDEDSSDRAWAVIRFKAEPLDLEAALDAVEEHLLKARYRVYSYGPYALRGYGIECWELRPC